MGNFGTSKNCVHNLNTRGVTKLGDQSLELQFSRHLVDDLARRAVPGLAQEEELVNILQFKTVELMINILVHLGLTCAMARRQ